MVTGFARGGEWSGCCVPSFFSSGAGFGFGVGDWLIVRGKGEGGRGFGLWTLG